jgi:hypothetical protein
LEFQAKTPRILSNLSFFLGIKEAKIIKKCV